MANGGTIQYNIGFNVDKTGLNQLKSSLMEIKNLTSTDLLKINNINDIKVAEQQLDAIQKSAGQLEGALERAFNVNLGTLNISKFNQELQKMDLKQIHTNLSLAGATGQKAFRDVTAQVLTTNMKLRETHTILDKIGTTMGNTIKWGLTSGIWNKMTGELQQAYGYVKALDGSLNDIRIVTGASADEMDRFAVKANDAAKKLGQGTKDYTNAALIYYQQGLSQQEVEAKTDITLKTANVTGQSTDAVSEQLTAIWNGYKVNAAEAELYVDKLSAVAATTASDLEELATGMSRVASAANVMGVDVDQLNAQLATIVSVTREAPETIGTSLKTVYSRMGDIQAGLDGEVSLDEYTEQMSKMGVNVLDSNNQLRDMGEVIEEVGGKWSSMSREQQVALTQIMAGSRQYSRLMALFDNWDMYEDALQTSAGAAGTLNEQNEIYMESTEAHLAKAKAAAEDLYDSLLDNDTINFFADLSAGVLDFGANFVDAIGGGNNLLLSLGSIATNVFSKQISGSIATSITNIKSFFDNIKQRQAELSVINIFNGIENVNDNALRDIISMKEEQLKYDKVLTAEAENYGNELIKQRNILADQLDQLEEKKQKALGIAERQTGIEYEDNEEGRKQAEADLLENYEKINKALEDRKKKISAIQQLQERYDKEVTADESTDDIDLDIFKKAKDEAKSYIADIQKEILLGRLDEKSLENLKERKNELEKALNEEEIEGETQVLLDALINIETEHKRALTVTKNSIKEQASALGTLTDSQNNLMKSDEELAETWQNYINKLNMTNAINGVIQLTSALSNLAAIWTTFKNLGSIWSNEDLSTGDKIVQTIQAFTSLGMQVVNFMKIYNDLTKKDSIISVGLSLIKATYLKQLDEEIKKKKELNKIQDELNDNSKEEAANDIAKSVTKNLEHTPSNSGAADDIMDWLHNEDSTLADHISNANSETITSITLGTKLRAVWGTITTGISKAFAFLAPFTPMIITITVAAAALAAVWYLQNKELIKANKELEKAEAKANDLTKTTQELTNRYNELNSELKSLESAQKTLDGLTKGSLEWKQALLDVNQQVLDLITKYPELAQYMERGEDGSLSLSEEGIKEYQEKEADKISQMQSAQLYAQADVAQAKANKKREEVLRYKQFSSGRVAGKDSQVQYFSTENFDKAIKAVDKFGTGILMNEQALQEAFQSLDGTILSFDEATGILNHARDELQDISQANLKEEIFKEQASQIAGQKAAEKLPSFENLSNDIQSAIAKGAGKEITKLAEENIKKDKRTDAQIQEAYKKLIGAEKIEKGEDGKIKYLDADGKVISEVETSSARFALAMEDASKAGEGFAKRIQDSLFKIPGDDKVKNALAGFVGGKGGSLKGIDDATIAKLDSMSAQELVQYAEDADYGTGIDAGRALVKAIDDAVKDEADRRWIDYQDILNKAGEKSNRFSKDSIQSMFTDKDYKSLLDEGFEPSEVLGKVDWSKVLNKEDLEKQINNIKEEINLSDVSSLAEKYDLDENKFRDTAKYIMENAEASDELADSLANDSDAVKDVTKALLRYDRAIETVSEKYDDWMQALTKGSMTDQIEATSELKDAYADLLDTDPEYLTDSFAKSTKNLELMKQAINGNEDALERLRDIAAKEYIVDVGIDPNTQVGQELNNLIDSIDINDFEVGATLDDTGMTNALQTMLDNGQITVDQLNGILENISMDMEVDSETVPLSQFSQDTHTGNYTYTYTDPDGNPRVYTVTAADYAAMDQDTMITIPIINGKKTKKVAPTKSQIKSGGNKHKGSGKGGGGGGSKSKPQKKDPFKSQIDRYHDVNLELKKLENQLEDISREQDKLFGKDLINNLNKELKILEKQRDVLQQKVEIAKAEAAELKGRLSSQGVTFDSEGDISNYASLLKAKEDYLNSLINQYNSMSAEEQEKFEETIEKAQEDYDKLKEDIERYDELITDEIPSIGDEIQEAFDREFEIKIEKFRINIDITMDMKDLTDKWLDFKKEVIDGISEDDTLGQAMASFDKLQSLNNPIEKLTEQLNAEIGEFKEVFNGGSDIYGNNQQQSLENSKETLEQLMDLLMEQKELIKEIRDYHIESIEQAIETFDKHIEQYETINDLIEHDMNLIELLYGEDEYEAMDKFYEEMNKNNLKQMEALKQQANDSKKRYDAEREAIKQLENDRLKAESAGDTEAAKVIQEEIEHRKKVAEIWYDSWIEATQEVNDLVEKSVEDIISEYQNSVNKIFDDLTKKMTGGRKLDFLSEEWDLINQNADRYLDTINETYALQELENKYLEAINDTDSLKAQKDLNNLMNDQLDMLREKDKLTEADIERANMMYDIALKQIALEEAQKNKSQMRLRRDAQGNYSYQFVSDEDAIADAQRELAAAQNELYNFDKEQYRNNLSEVLNIYGEFQDRMVELMSDTTLSFEEREAQKAILAEQYQSLITGYVEENEWLRLNLKDSAFAEMANLYQTDVENFRQMSQEEQEELMSNLVPQWDSAIQTMTDKFVVDFIPSCQNAFGELSKTTLEYETDLQKIEETAQISFSGLQEGYSTTAEEIQGLMDKNDDLYKQYEDQIDAMERIDTLLGDQLSKYKSITDEAKRASEAAYGVIQAQLDLEKHEAEQAAKQAQSEMEEEMANNAQQAGSAAGKSGAGGQYTIKKGDNLWKLAQQRTGDGTRWKEIYNMNQEIIDSTAKRYGYAGGGHWIFPGTVLTMPFDTGGYTGDWSGDGRLAMLHQKELVLNAEDTANILSAVSIVRNIDALLSSLNASMLSGLNSSFGTFGLNNETFEQNVHIEANFPNVVNREEIEAAFNNLTNIASQRAYNNKR